MPSKSAPLDHNASLVLEAKHHDVFSYLGPHLRDDGQVVVRAMLPRAQALNVVLKETGESFSADLLHQNGLFEAILPAHAWQRPYELVWRNNEGHSVHQEDVYSF